MRRASVAGPAGNRGLLAEEVDRHPVAGEVAVRRAGRRSGSPSAPAAPRARLRARAAPPPCRSPPARRRTTRTAPAARPVRPRPSARPRGRRARWPRSRTRRGAATPGSVPSRRRARLRRAPSRPRRTRGSTETRASRGQPEQLEPVAAVRRERVRHHAVERASLAGARRSRVGGSWPRGGDARTGTGPGRGRFPPPAGSRCARGSRSRSPPRPVREVRRSICPHS